MLLPRVVCCALFLACADPPPSPAPAGASTSLGPAPGADGGPSASADATSEPVAAEQASAPPSPSEQPAVAEVPAPLRGGLDDEPPPEPERPEPLDRPPDALTERTAPKEYEPPGDDYEPEPRPGAVSGATDDRQRGGVAPQVAAGSSARSSRAAPPQLLGGAAWSCPFPAEADAAGVDSAAVTLLVTVDASGKPTGVSVVSDPGHGFGKAARGCALSQRYAPAKDDDGQPVAGTTPPLRIRFSR